MKLPLYHLLQSSVSSIDVTDALFVAKPHRDVLERVVRWQLAKRQSGHHSVLGMGEVRGSTAKPWRQKKTGRARQGSRHGPHFRGGGVVFGPVVRSHAHQLPKRVRQLALRSALSVKRDAQSLFVVESMSLQEGRTKIMAQALAMMNVRSAMLVAGETLDEPLRRATRNLPHVMAVSQAGINAYDVLRHDHLLVSKDALPYLEARLS